MDWKSVVTFTLLMGWACVTMTQVPECCFECSCTLCGDLAQCEAYGDIDPPNTSPANVCKTYKENDPVNGQGCGTDSDPLILCSEWYDNSSYTGTTVDSYSSTSGTNPCIPIDGGLGFLIAGGVGMGLFGIRRRKQEVLAC